MKKKNKKEYYVKVGRIYWIEPKKVKGWNNKLRPAIALEEYDSSKTIFILLSSQKYKSKNSASSQVNQILHEEWESCSFTRKRKNCSYAIIEFSKPERNNVTQKPQFHIQYEDLLFTTIEKIRKIYHGFQSERIKRLTKKALSLIKQNKVKEAKDILQFLKDIHPNEYKNFKLLKLTKKHF